MIGLALSLRIGALVLFGYVALWFFWGWLASLRKGDGSLRFGTRGLIRVAARASIVVALSFIVLYPWWPYGQANPVARSIEALAEISRYPWDGNVLFNGDFIRAAELPWFYLPVWMGITLPPILPLMLLAGAVLAAARLTNLSRQWRSSRLAGIALVFFAAIFPVVYVIAKDSILYDGMRHLLFVIPALCVLAGLSIDQLFRRPCRKALRWALALSLIASALHTTTAMIRLHPYQYVYFNGWIGGLPGAEGRFETEYWGTAYREAVELLDEHVSETGQNRPKVSSAPMPSCPDIFSRRTGCRSTIQSKPITTSPRPVSISTEMFPARPYCG